MRLTSKQLGALAAGLVLVLTCTRAVAGGDPVAGQKVAQRCQQCHGDDGNSPNPLFPRLAGQYATYLLRTLLDYKSGARDNPIMKGFAGQLSEQEMEDASAFYASQGGELFTITLSK